MTFLQTLIKFLLYRLVVCDDYDFSKDMIGYDLRRNESVTKEYRRRFSPNMYSKVRIIKPYNGNEVVTSNYFRRQEK